MFGWLKRMLSGAPAPPPPPATSDAPAAEKPTSSGEVVANFLEQNPTRTPWSVHALIAAGAARLPDQTALIMTCDKIEEHGYQYPLNPTLQHNLPKADWLPFLRWQAGADVGHEEYENDQRIGALIERFQAER